MLALGTLTRAAPLRARQVDATVFQVIDRLTKDRTKTFNRLKRIEGQARGIAHMVSPHFSQRRVG
jgi:hypothetical protein